MVLLSIRESHIDSIKKQESLIEIIKNSKFVLTNLNFEYSVKKLSNMLGKNIYRAIVLNGIDYLSPNIIFVRGHVEPLNIVVDKDAKEEYPWNKIFKQDFYKLIERESEEYKCIYIKRKILTLISFLSVIYRKNVGETVLENKNFLNNLCEELFSIHGYDSYKGKNLLEEVINPILENTDIFFYYTSHFKNFHIRGKDISKDVEYFFEELKDLSSGNYNKYYNKYETLLELEKNLRYLFRINKI